MLNTRIVPVSNPLDVKVKDENDLKVKENAENLLRTIPVPINSDEVKQKFPIGYRSPLYNLLNREVNKYNRLLEVIRSSLTLMIDVLEGKETYTDELEKLWHSILFNIVPNMWLKASYQTCYRSLGNYIVNLTDRMNFIKKWVEHGDPDSYWFPGFFDQQSFLVSLLQKRARREAISLN